MAQISPAGSAVTKGRVLTMLDPTVTVGDDFYPGNVRLLVFNGSGSPITATTKTPATDQYGSAIADIVSPSIGAGAYAVLGPFPADLADPTTGLVNVTLSSVASVKIALIA